MKFLKAWIAFASIVYIPTACLTGDAQRTGTPAASPTAGATPKAVTEADLTKLRWIVGTWKGTGGGAEPFYERYTFRDAQTLAVDSFENDSLSRVTDTSIYKLDNGHLTNGSYALSEITDDAVKFVPVVANVRNTFIWSRESESVWKATLTWPAKDSKPAGERVCIMARLEEKL